jgi:hypothetical protein
MANLPEKHPNLSLHLTDRALTPLITSSQTQEQLQSLASVSHAALVAYESALRLGLGSPQRIMIEHSSNGPILLHSYINPTLSGSVVTRSLIDRARNLLPAGADQVDDEERGSHAVVGRGAVSRAQEEPDASEDGTNAPPMLLSTVIAPSADSALEARRASARLERVGREVQTQWTQAQQRDESARTGD